MTLARVTSPAGETNKIHAGRQWAVHLGTFPFAIGILTRQWPLAVTGIIYSIIAAGCALGIWLGLLSRGYLLLLLHQVGWSRVILEHADAQTATVSHLHLSLFSIGVLLAPPAEEFLFRGLLYRALDREWGGLRALAGSAAFFAIYQPLRSWAPVALLGFGDAMLFKRGGTLVPAVLSPMVCNAIVPA